MEQLIPVKTGVSLCTRTDGSGPPLLLIMGIRLQLIHWPADLCQALQDAGFQVIRFDNRDSGRSSKLDTLGAPSLGQLAPTHRIPPPYSLDEMADDTLGLMDALGLESAHVLGVSMGGMIAQLMALKAPERLRSLSLMMTTSGGIYVPVPRALFGLLRPRKVDGVESYTDAFLSVQAALRGSQDVATAETVAELRAVCAAAWDRDPAPTEASFMRQLAAISSAPDRARALAGVTVPTRLIHGADDPLLPARASFDLARRLPNADLSLIPGMGHNLPKWARPRIAALVAEHAWKHEQASHAAARA